MRSPSESWPCPVCGNASRRCRSAADDLSGPTTPTSRSRSTCTQSSAPERATSRRCSSSQHDASENVSRATGPCGRRRSCRRLTGDQTALVLVVHHVLADGIGGLAVLASLVDGPRDVGPIPFSRSAPTTSELRRNAFRDRVRALADLAGAVRRLRNAVTELQSTRPRPPPRSSLNQPTGSDRRLTVIRADLDEMRAVAHAHGATVNDVVLAAVAAALHELMASRGEHVDRFVVSIPVAARPMTNVTELGNRVGIVPVDIPATGDLSDRLEAIAATTRSAKKAPRGASASLIGPLFRLLAFMGIFNWFINRQRLVNTFVTNLRGPDARMAFLDAPITDVIPVAVVTGNVPVSFAVLSYAGTLAITVIADPLACPHLETLTGSLKDQLDHLALHHEAGAADTATNP